MCLKPNFLDLNKIDVSKIVRSHFSTFRDYRTGKRKIEDFLLFLGMPLLVATTFTCCRVLPDQNSITSIVIFVSVFIIPLFNLLFLLSKIQRHESNNQLRTEIIKEMYSNASFCVLVAVFTVVASILADMVINTSHTTAYQFFSFAVYYLATLFLLTLLMVLKRVYIFFHKEIDV